MQTDSMNDIVISGLDQIIPMQKAQKEVLQRVDDITAEAIKNGDPTKAFKAMNSLLGISQVSGVAFSKFVYVIKYNWKSFNQRTDFYSYAETSFGRGKKSIDDNFRVWEFLVTDDVPKEYRDKFMNFPIRCLIPIANLWKQGWDVEPHQWLRLSQAPDPSTIGKIIREIKKKEPKKGSLQMEWVESEKEIIVWVDSKPHPIYLTYDENDPEVMKGLERLLNGKVMARA